ncbi:uncharacterized protein LOC129601637 [Paramacrobiotus metropolitanus]|uniref:uncharacterized protein LOC129601637 n=1 Tax=Paramacrobiotus metropolitanus TaxID=2943436 RepID=UPI0024456CCA|nr:uncharacterized protein LOC129601637 [Paramacrobiotus metropolitanus]
MDSASCASSQQCSRCGSAKLLIKTSHRESTEFCKRDVQRNHKKCSVCCTARCCMIAFCIVTTVIILAVTVAATAIIITNSGKTSDKKLTDNETSTSSPSTDEDSLQPTTNQTYLCAKDSDCSWGTLCGDFDPHMEQMVFFGQCRPCEEYRRCKIDRDCGDAVCSNGCCPKHS